MTDVAIITGALASLVTAFAVIIGLAVIARRMAAVDTKLKRVEGEVKTGNGKTIAMLVGATEGRRIQADVPMGERTIDEQHYVDRLDDTTTPADDA